MPTARQLLTTLSGNYIPTHSLPLFIMQNRPTFNLSVVPEMLHDPRVKFGLRLLKGPILANSQFLVNTDRAPEDKKKVVKDFLIRNVTRFWRNSASRAMEAIDYGYSGHEVLYKVEDRMLTFDILKNFNAADIRPVSVGGNIKGIELTGKGTTKPQFIGGQKAFWHVHERELDPWFGRSRLFSAFIPWLEKWTDGGFRAARRLWWHKYAFDGGTLYHPTGDVSIQGGGTEANKNIARRIMEAAKAGGTRVFPSTFKDGQRTWEYVGATSPGAPAGLEAYGDSLNDEILEALGIPPEVVRADGTGAFAGRRIPQQAFFSVLTDLVSMLMSDIDQQIFRHLVEFNFGPNIPYDIIPFGLLKRPGATDQPDKPIEEEEEGGFEMSIPLHGLSMPNYGIIAA